MKLSGGYMPKIAGRPASTIREIPSPNTLYIPLEQDGLSYEPVVKNGQKISFGDALAEVSVPGGKLSLPAPAGGKVRIHKNDEGKAQQLIIETGGSEAVARVFDQLKPERPTEKYQLR